MSISEIPDGQIGPTLPMLFVEVHRCPATCPAWLAPRKEDAEHGDERADAPVAALYTDDPDTAHQFAAEETHRYRRMHAGIYLIHAWTGEASIRLRSYTEGKLIDAVGES